MTAVRRRERKQLATTTKTEVTIVMTAVLFILRPLTLIKGCRWIISVSYTHLTLPTMAVV